MKKLQLLTLILGLMLLAPGTALAHDFEAANAEGVTMYFNILDATEHTAAVTYYGTSYSSVPADKKYTGAVIIPETFSDGTTLYTVTEVGDRAFQSCTKLTEITIPERITFIGKCAFSSCTGLRTIHINALDCEMEFSAGYTNYAPFTGASDRSNPATVYFADGITNISAYAFYNSNIGYVYIPSSVESIGNYAFFACSYLKELHSDITDPASVSLGSSVFYNQSTCKLLVPNGTSALYSVADQWKNFTNIGEAYLLLTAGTPYVFKPNSFSGSSRTITFVGKARDVQPATVEYTVCPEGTSRKKRNLTKNPVFILSA